MRRHDLLDAYATAIVPALRPQALMRSRPGTGARQRMPRHRATLPRLGSLPAVAVALLCILIVFI